MPDNSSNDHHPVLTTPSTPPADQPEDDERSSAFEVALVIIRAYPQTLRNGALIAAAGALAIFIAGWLLLPTDRFGTVQFRVLFQGADQGKYPNGTPFSGSEVVAPLILDAVYKTNDLQRYMDFGRFKESMFALDSNPDLVLLSMEYQTRLADTKLTAVDRVRLEDEFRKKKESMRSAVFSLNLHRTERLKALPNLLTLKILDDVLVEWARQARSQKGVLKYDVGVFSGNVLERDAVRDEDYIIAADMLRTKVNKILKNIELISKTPGAMLIRTGKTRLSLAEIRSNLEDRLRFEIEPLVRLIAARRLSKNPQESPLIVQDQLRQLVLAREASTQRMKAIQGPLSDYVAQSTGGQVSGSDRAQSPFNGPTVMPQLGESFLHQIVDMSMLANDAQYRQEMTQRVIDEGLEVASNARDEAYYRELNAMMSGWGKGTEAVESKEIAARLERLTQSIAATLDDVIAIYEDLSARNLDPGTMLYAVTTPPVVRTERAVPLGTIAALAGLAWLASVAAIMAGCAIHSRYRGSRP